MKLSVVIVNYNVKYYLEQCLLSVSKALKGIDAEIIVVDNHSRDNSVAYIKQRFPHITIIENIHNVGFARANNIAIRQTDSDYVLLLNPDTFVAEQTIKKTVNFLDEHPDTGGVGVQMINQDGSRALESRRGLPTPMTAFYKMCGLCRRFPKSKRFGKYYMSYLSWDEPAVIDIVSGAFFMIRRLALDKTGLLDETFFMYGEDIDLSYRIQKAGYQNWYLPLQILHYKGESTQKSSFRYVHVFYQAMLIFFQKHYNHLSWLVTIPIKLAIYVRATMALMNMLYQKLRRSLGFAEQMQDIKRYVFIGSQNMLEHCRKIAQNYGFDASYISMNQAIPKTEDRAILVFDTQSFNYEDIIKMLSEQDSYLYIIGMFYSDTNTLITPFEIFI